MKKIILSVAAAGVVLVGGALAYAYLSLNSLVKKGVETWGPRLTKTEVTLRSVSLMPFSGAGTLNGLVIGNPKGYAGDAFSVRRAGVAVEPKSLLTSVAVIRKIEVIDPEIAYEGSLSDGNLQQLERNVAGPPAPAPKGAAPEAKAPAAKAAPKAPAPERKVIIDDILLRGAKATITLTQPRLAKPVVVALPEIHLTGIGRKAGGVTPGEAAREIFSALTDAVKKKAGEAVKAAAQDQIRKALGSGGKDLGKDLGKALNGLFKKK